MLVYDRISREAPGCFDHFDEQTLYHLRQMNYTGLPDEEVLSVGHGPAAVGGQWTLGNARLFSSKEYLDFADHMASGIYMNRWADQIILLRGASLYGPRAEKPVLEQVGGFSVPATTVCLEPLFIESGSDPVETAGFVHEKAGFRNQNLLRTCGADANPTAFEWLAKVT